MKSRMKIFQVFIMEAVRPTKSSEKRKEVKVGAGTKKELSKSKIFSRFIYTAAGSILIKRGILIEGGG